MEYLVVGLGGCLGSMARYGAGQLVNTADMGFPFVTLLINFIGSFVIGLVSEFAGMHVIENPRVTLFLKVGLCGGFTTFSTFSLETLGLFEKGDYGMGTLYAFVSVVACVFGVLAGQMIARVVAPA